MSAIGKFARENRNILTIANVFEEIEGGIVDSNINLPRMLHRHRFAMKNGIKDIVFENGMPTCLDLAENRRYVFRALQFQGDSKALIPDFYTAAAFEPAV
jgi:hypothetical protein